MRDETMHGDMFSEAPREEMPPQLPPLAPVDDEATGEARTTAAFDSQPLSFPGGGLFAAPPAAAETSAPEHPSAPEFAAPPPVPPAAPPYGRRTQPAPSLAGVTARR